MSILVEALLSLLFELIFEGLGEILAELGFDLFEKAKSSRTLGPVLRTAFYVVFGILLGICSYFVLPVHVVENQALRILGMFVSIAGAGAMLCGVSWFVSRKDRNEGLWSTSKFIQGVCFGAAYSLTRAVAIA